MSKADSDLALVIRDDLNQLESFSVDLKAAEFSSLTSQLSADAMVAQDFGPEEGLSDERFHKSIEKTYYEMQKFIFQEAFSVKNEKTQNLAISEKSCDLDDSFSQTKINLDRLIERNYKILFLVALAASGFLLVNLI